MTLAGSGARFIRFSFGLSAALAAASCQQLIDIPSYTDPPAEPGRVDGCTTDEECPQPEAGSCKHAVCDAATHACIRKSHGFHVKRIDVESPGTCAGLHPSGCIAVAADHLFLVAQKAVVAFDVRAPATERPTLSVAERAVDAETFELAASGGRLWAVAPSSGGETSISWLDVTGTEVGSLQSAKLSSRAQRAVMDALVPVELASGQPALVLRLNDEDPSLTTPLERLALVKVTTEGSSLASSPLDTDPSKLSGCDAPSRYGASVSGARVVLAQSEHLSVVPLEDTAGQSTACLSDALQSDTPVLLGAAADGSGAVAGAAITYRFTESTYTHLNAGWLFPSKDSTEANGALADSYLYTNEFVDAGNDELSLAVPTDKLFAVAAPTEESLDGSISPTSALSRETRILVYDSSGGAPGVAGQRTLVLNVPTRAVKLAAQPNTTYVYVYTEKDASSRSIDVLDIACDDLP